MGLEIEAPPDPPNTGGESSLSFEEVQARSENARRVLEEMCCPAARTDADSESGGLRGEMAPDAGWSDSAISWFSHYLKLRELGFSWRIACYIAWAASPKRERWPKTQEELATEVLGLASARQISEWRRKYPKIDDAIALIQAAPLWEHRADIYAALVEVATDADYKNHPDRKLALEMLGDYVPRSKVEASIGEARDLSDLTDEELDALAEGLGIEVAKGVEGSEVSEGPEVSEGSEVSDVSE